MSDTTKPKSMMTLDELKQTPEYADCSDKMKLFLVTLIENGFNYTAATRAAFKTKDPAKYSWAVRNWPAVRHALNVYRGWSAFDIWMDAVQRASRNRKVTIAQLQALKLQSDAMGWNSDGLDQRLHGKPIPPIQPAAAISKPQAPRTSAAAPGGMGSANDVPLI